MPYSSSPPTPLPPCYDTVVPGVLEFAKMFIQQQYPFYLYCFSFTYSHSAQHHYSRHRCYCNHPCTCTITWQWHNLHCYHFQFHYCLFLPFPVLFSCYCNLHKLFISAILLAEMFTKRMHNQFTTSNDLKLNTLCNLTWRWWLPKFYCRKPCLFLIPIWSTTKLSRFCPLAIKHDNKLLPLHLSSATHTLVTTRSTISVHSPSPQFPLSLRHLHKHRPRRCCLLLLSNSEKSWCCINYQPFTCLRGKNWGLVFCNSFPCSYCCCLPFSASKRWLFYFYSDLFEKMIVLFISEIYFAISIFVYNFPQSIYSLLFQVLLELSRSRNKIPLPKSIAPPGSIPLPPEQDTLINPNYQLLIPTKQPSQIEETEEDHMPSSNPNSNSDTMLSPAAAPIMTSSDQQQQQQGPQRVSFPLAAGVKRPRWAREGVF